MKAEFDDLLERVTGAQSSKVLSVYLDIDQTLARNLSRGFETVLNTTLKNVQRKLQEEEERGEFAAAAALAKDFIAHYHPSGKGLVLFISAGGILMTRDLNIAIPTEVRWGTPHIQPYLAALDEFERHIIVATDKWQARLLSVFLERIESVVEIEDNPHTTHIHEGGMDRQKSQPVFHRKSDENARNHVRHVIRELENMIENRPANRLLLAGNTEAVGEIFRFLPKHLKTRVVGTMRMALASSDEEIVKAALPTQTNAERRFELQTIERLTVAAGKKDKAVVGVDDTLTALINGRVLSLIYAEGLNLSGRKCAGCEALFADKAGQICGLCGMALRGTEDLLDLALIKALDTGASIEQVRGTAAEKLREIGGIGAFLRY